MTIEAGPDELFTTRAKPADVAAIVELVNGAYRGDSSRRGWTTEADLIDGTRIDAAAVEDLLATPGCAVLVLRAQSGLLGCVEVRRRSAGTAYVGMLTVRPALQGSGIGRQMLAAAETYARQEYWYERRGYQPTGELRPFPYEESRFGVPKSPDLRMVVLRKALAP